MDIADRDTARPPPECAVAEGGRLDRIGPAIGVATVHALIGYMLILGLGVAIPRASTRDPPSPIVITLKPPQPHAAPSPKQHEPAKRGDATSPPAQPPPPKVKTAPIMPTPAAVMPLPAPLAPPAPPVVTGSGSNMAGTGIIGVGRGSSGAGGGDGAGDGRGDGSGRGFSEARQIGGRFRNSDFPPSAHEAGRLRIGVRYAVGPTGRVVQCEIIDTSGYPEVDAMTCRVIVDRYRFRPARDEDGVAITEVMEENYTWLTE